MKTGDKVRLYPHGEPEQAVTAEIVMLGDRNPPEKSIMLRMDKLPVFGLEVGIAIHPELGVMFCGSYYGVGPWVELFGGGHYEIEEIKD